MATAAAGAAGIAAGYLGRGRGIPTEAGNLKPMRNYKLLLGSQRLVSSLAISRDGARIAYLTSEGGPLGFSRRICILELNAGAGRTTPDWRATRSCIFPGRTIACLYNGRLTVHSCAQRRIAAKDYGFFGRTQRLDGQRQDSLFLAERGRIESCAGRWGIAGADPEQSAGSARRRSNASRRAARARFHSDRHRCDADRRQRTFGPCRRRPISNIRAFRSHPVPEWQCLERHPVRCSIGTPRGSGGSTRRGGRQLHTTGHRRTGNRHLWHSPGPAIRFAQAGSSRQADG